MRCLTIGRLFLFALVPIRLIAQTADLSGIISDPSGLAVPNAKVTVKSRATGVTREVVSNQQGLYSIPALPPGSYDLTVEATGFKSIHQTGILLEVDQRATPRFRAYHRQHHRNHHGRRKRAAAQRVRRIREHRDRQPVRREYALERPQLQLAHRTRAGRGADTGESVRAGPVQRQRPAAGCELLHGGWSQRQPRQRRQRRLAVPRRRRPASRRRTPLGASSNLVSLDALEEFRIQTSTFAPEYGRTPGAQVSVRDQVRAQTRSTAQPSNTSATTSWMPTIGSPMPRVCARPELRQNDFGGVLGGPIRKDKLFFFGSYEGLRVRQPHVANTYVPILASRQNAPAAVQPLLNAFPLPNGPDLGNGTAAFAAGYSDPSTLDSSSIRIDYLPTQRVTIFGRYSNAPSRINQRGRRAATSTATSRTSNMERRF